MGWGWVIPGICGFYRTGVMVRTDESKGSLCCFVYVWLGEEKASLLWSGAPQIGETRDGVLWEPGKPWER